MIFKTGRSSNFELLRIILIAMMVTVHLLGHGGALGVLTIKDKNYFSADIMESFCIVAVSCFILISGYFGIKANLKKLLVLESQVLFYSISISILFLILKLCVPAFAVNFSIKEMIKAFVPVITSRWWFITTYILLFSISPFINIFISKLDKNTYKIILIVSVFLLYVLPTFRVNPLNNDNGYGLNCFIFLYMLGSYIRKYYKKKINRYAYLSSYVICTLIISVARYGLSIVFKEDITWFWEYNNIIVLLSAMSLFLFFREIKIRSIVINKISSLVLAVYLISVHPSVTAYIYRNIFHTELFYYSNLFVFQIIASMVIIFLTCLIIEYLRRVIFNKFEDKLATKVSKMIKSSTFLRDKTITDNVSL